MVITATYGNPRRGTAWESMPTAIFSGSSSFRSTDGAPRPLRINNIFQRRRPGNSAAESGRKRIPGVPSPPRRSDTPYAVPPTGSAQYKTLRRFLHDESRTVQVRLRKDAPYFELLPIVTAPCVPTIRRLHQPARSAALHGNQFPNRPRSIPPTGGAPDRTVSTAYIHPPSVEIRSFAVVPVQYLSENPRIRRIAKSLGRRPRPTARLRPPASGRAPEDRRRNPALSTGKDNRAPPNNCGTLR